MGIMMRDQRRWILLAFLGGTAALRWFIMLRPEHFRPWQPASWFAPDVIEFTRVFLDLGAVLICLALIPWLFLPRLLGRPATRADWGLPAPRFEQGGGKQTKVLAVAALVVGILAVWGIPELSRQYPVGQLPGRSVLFIILGQLGTLGILLVSELFYRGVALFSLERHFGKGAVYLLVPAYAINHVGSPAVEFWSAVVLALLLGHLALKTRSVWPALLVHGVASVSVDLSSLLMQ